MKKNTQNNFFGGLFIDRDSIQISEEKCKNKESLDHIIIERNKIHEKDKKKPLKKYPPKQKCIQKEHSQSQDSVTGRNQPRN